MLLLVIFFSKKTTGFKSLQVSSMKITKMNKCLISISNSNNKILALYLIQLYLEHVNGINCAHLFLLSLGIILRSRGLTRIPVYEQSEFSIGVY